MRKWAFLVMILFLVAAPQPVYSGNEPVSILVYDWKQPQSALESADAIVVTENTLISFREELADLVDNSIIIYKGNQKHLIDTIRLASLLKRNSAPYLDPGNYSDVISGVYIRNGVPMLVTYVGSGIDPVKQPQGLEGFIKGILSSADKYLGYDAASFPAVRTYLPSIYGGVGSAYWQPDAIFYISYRYCPYGEYTEVDVSQKVENDDDRKWDYWAVEIEQNLLPGQRICGDGSLWLNNGLMSQVNPLNSANLYKYGPLTTIGQSSASVSLGFSKNGPSLGMSWSFPSEDVTIFNYSEVSNNFAKWLFQLDGSGPVVGSTFTSQPGVSIYIPDGKSPYFLRKVEPEWLFILSKRFTEMFTMYFGD